MKRIILACLFLMLGCVDEDRTRRVLESQGYRAISITGWNPFACGQDDDVTTGFTAIGPGGKQVSGAVCCQLVFKACTVRIE